MPETVITISPIGGLANRMRAILAAAALAHDNGSALRIVWTRGKELNARFADLFEVDTLTEGLSERFGIHAELQEAGTMQTFLLTPPLKRNLYLTRLYQAAAFHKSLFDWHLEPLLPHPEDIKGITEHCNIFIASGLGFYPYSDDIFRECFVPVKALREAVQDRLASLPHPLVGIHIRRTDNQASIQESPTELFIEKMSEREGNAAFLLATDDEKVKQELNRKFPGRVYTSQSQAERHTLNGMKDAVIDMYSLVNTDFFIGSYYSSFTDIIIAIREGDLTEQGSTKSIVAKRKSC